MPEQVPPYAQTAGAPPQVGAKINSLTQVVEDLKEQRALHERLRAALLEFPEALDDEGRFTGFDVVGWELPYPRVRGASAG